MNPVFGQCTFCFQGHQPLTKMASDLPQSSNYVALDPQSHEILRQGLLQEAELQPANMRKAHGMYSSEKDCQILGVG